MHILIKLHAQKLATEMYNTGFLILEINGDQVPHIPYSLDKQFDNKEDAIKYSEKSALDHIHKNYPQGMKYRIDND